MTSDTRRSLPMVDVVIDVVHATGDTSGSALATAVATISSPGWRLMPQVWWPWMCQLVGAIASETSTAALLDLVSLERRQINHVLVPAGTPFAVCVDRSGASLPAERELASGWADCGAAVTVLAGRDGRSAWVCLSRGHRRLVLTGVATNLFHCDKRGNEDRWA
jgi:hypothetical protein